MSCTLLGVVLTLVLSASAWQGADSGLLQDLEHSIQDRRALTREAGWDDRLILVDVDDFVPSSVAEGDPVGAAPHVRVTQPGVGEAQGSAVAAHHKAESRTVEGVGQVRFSVPDWRRASAYLALHDWLRALPGVRALVYTGAPVRWLEDGSAGRDRTGVADPAWVEVGPRVARERMPGALWADPLRLEVQEDGVVRRFWWTGLSALSAGQAQPQPEAPLGVLAGVLGAVRAGALEEDWFGRLVVSLSQGAGGAGQRRGPLTVRVPAQPGWVMMPFAGAGAPLHARFLRISAREILAGHVSADQFAGRIVLVGSSAGWLDSVRLEGPGRSSGERIPVPWSVSGAGPERPGVQRVDSVQALREAAAQQERVVRVRSPIAPDLPALDMQAMTVVASLDGVLPWQPAWAVQMQAGLMLLTGLVLAWWLPQLTAGVTLVLGGLAAAFVLTGHLALETLFGWTLPLAGPVALVVLLAFLNGVMQLVMNLRARSYVQEVFGQNVSPQLLSKMLRHPHDYSAVSQNRRLTVLFADIRGFTRMAESMEPQVLREYLNRVLTRLTDCVHAHQGTVDKYMGDAVMAFWGAPVEDPRQEDHAVQSALAMLAVVDELNEEFLVRGWPALSIGVGVNSGMARVGDMGTQLRHTYTAIGDAVNLAARLESLTKQFGFPVLLGEGTARGVSSLHLVALGDARVVGRSESVQVFTPRVLLEQTPDEGEQVTTVRPPARAAVALIGGSGA